MGWRDFKLSDNDNLNNNNNNNKPDDELNCLNCLNCAEVDSEKEPNEAVKLDCVLYKSKILDGEEVLVIRDENDLDKYRAEYPDTVIYTPSEIDELNKFKGDKDAIKVIHLAKKKFDGQIIKETINQLTIQEATK